MAVARRDVELLKSLGAHEVIDDAPSDLQRGGFDLILDTPGILGFKRAKTLLAATGKYMSLHMSLKLLAQMCLTGLLGGRRALFGVSFPTGEDLDAIRELVDQNALRPVIDSAYPLDRVVEAHERVEHRPRGTVVVRWASGVALSRP